MEIISPMAAKVVEILISVADQVKADQEIVLLESMKMVIPVTAPSAGVVAAVAVSPDDIVEEGQLLVTVTPE